MNKCEFCGKMCKGKFCGFSCRGGWNKQQTKIKDKNVIKEWIKLAEKGDSLEDIGDRYNITRERVRQILKRNNINIKEFHGFRLTTIYKYKCDNCGKFFWVHSSHKSIFCSSKCLGEQYHKLTIDVSAPRKTVPSRKYPMKKYKMIYVGMFNGKAKYQFEHRLIMEKELGRSLKKTEHVHHIDGNGLNNKIWNLEVLDQRDHGRISTKNNVSRGIVDPIEKRSVRMSELNSYLNI